MNLTYKHTQIYISRIYRYTFKEVKYENHVMKNLEKKQDKLVRKTWDKRWRTDISLVFSSLRDYREVEEFRVRNITFLLHPFEKNRECKFPLYKKTKNIQLS